MIIMESSGHADGDIKEECVEIVAEIDAESVADAAAIYTSGEKEPSTDSRSASSRGVYMNDSPEETPGEGDDNVILLDRGDREPYWPTGRPERETIKSLIEMVRSQPEIWDITNAAYREKLLRKRSFRRIAEQLGWSTEDVIKKYNNLRTYYTKEIIKQKRSASYQSKWPYFEQIDSFLRRTVHKRQPSTPNKWSRLASRNTPDRLGGLDNMQLASFKKKRQMVNSGDHVVRQRNNLGNRVAATLSTPPVESSSQPSVLTTLSTAGSRGQQNSQISISQVRSLASQQQHHQHQQQQQQTSTMPSSTQVTRQQSPRQASNMSLPASSPTVASRGLQVQLQRKPAQYQQPHQQQMQSHGKSKSPSIASCTGPTSSVTAYQLAPDQLPSPSAGQQLMESNDVIFGRLVTSQLSKIPEGRLKEQLKIKLMQQLVQAMFGEEQS